MSAALGSLWTILSSYRPNAARDRREAPPRFGAFKSTYLPPGFAVRRPRNDDEAQKLYNHIRTVAFWLDAAPLLADLGLPFRAGLDDIISLVPIYGDILSGVLQLYQVWLCFVFGVPKDILGYMFLNVLIDIVVGIVPLIGDFLDNLFKSNLRNLALLETYLLENPTAINKYHILLMPETTEFMPRPTKPGSKFGGWFGSASNTSGNAQIEEERRTGKVGKTRRMGKDEAEFFGSGPVPMEGMGTGSGAGTASASASASGTAAGSSGNARSTRTRRGGNPHSEPLD